MSAALTPLGTALFIVAAMSIAGVAHTVWMRSSLSRRFRMPLDAGCTWRGRRLLGDHKTLRGFMVMVPAAGLAFSVLGALSEALGAGGAWGLRPPGLFGLGAWAGFCFMAGELPNSFYKRRHGIAPGSVPTRGWERRFCLLVDRFDSTLALLVGMSVVVAMHWLTWVWVLVLGPFVHLGFSALLHVNGVKARIA
jgi:hypothetical protein